VLGMGKLGSREMTYLSDLDLVFVYEPKPGEPENQIPGGVIRLIQRFMNMLNTPLHEGPGYSVDARLRPTGTYGPLVVTKKSWLEYYTTDADIWEIQALLRVRHIAGDPVLGRWIEDRATEICYCERGSDRVWPRICHLRDRMEKERSDETASDINLKLGMGGLADIEFLVQGKLLLEGCKDGAIRIRSVRQGVREFLKTIGETSGKADEISTVFGALRALDHRLRLHTNSASSKLNENQFEDMLSLGLWPPRFDGSSIETWQDILRLRREVRSILRMFCPDLKAM
jgi:[glutamine synthetase] adenylyltransferase / [glutamine synthetase]-adenylyl-L-tyrosine phosphorylase